MTEANIYRLSKSPWNKAFPKLLEAIIAKGNKVHIICQNQELVESLDELLWTFEQLAFLPHATSKDPKPDAQPIILSTSLDVINGANIIAIIGSILPENVSPFEKIIYMYEATDIIANDFVKDKISTLKNRGIKLNYFSQNPTGNWEKAVA